MKISLKHYWDLLFDYLKPQWPSVALFTLLLFGSLGLQLVSPLIIGYFIDATSAHTALQTLTLIALLFMGAALLQQITSICETFLGENIGWTATNMLRTNLTKHCLNMDMAFHKEHTPGELIERIDGDVTEIANFFSRFFVQMLGSLLLIIGILAVLFYENIQVGLALTIYAMISVLALLSIRNLAVPLWVNSRQASADLFGFLEERLSGIEDIRTSNASAYVMHQLYKLMRALLQKYRKARLIGNLTFIMTSALYALGRIVGFALGIYLFDRGTVTLGTVYLIIYYIDILYRPLDRIQNQLEDLQRASASITRVTALFQTQSTIHETGSLPLPEGALAVEAQNVSFGYTEQETILHDLSFQLPAGKILGVLGRTGGGKTTLTRLLLHLYEAQQGTIRIGDRDIRDISQHTLYQHIGIVTQHVQLFHATVRDNVTFFDESIPDPAILQIIDDLGLKRWYATLSQGLDTLLEADHHLSAGEAQLLAFARVFLKNPGLVILDEASSRLDLATENLIEQAIDKLLQNRTCIIIAHRLHTLYRADDIMLIEDGRIREYGSRATLQNDTSSQFYRLLQVGQEEIMV